MLQSMKLRTDQLTDAAASNGMDGHLSNTTTVATLNPVLYTGNNTVSLPAPVAVANGLSVAVYGNNNIGGSGGSNSNINNIVDSHNNNNNIHMVNNNHLNNRHQHQQQLQQYQAKYLETAIAAETAAAATHTAVKVATSKTFHPYSRPPAMTTVAATQLPAITSATLSSPTSLPTMSFYPAQINSTNVKTSVANTELTTASSGLLTLPTTTASTAIASPTSVGSLLASVAMEQQQRQQQQQQHQSPQINP